VVAVGDNKEDVLEYRCEERLEECVARLLVGFGHIGNELEAHGETRAFNLAVVVLASPHARVNDKLEGSCIQTQQSREAAEIDGP
jgi:hypothetical protein